MELRFSSYQKRTSPVTYHVLLVPSAREPLRDACENQKDGLDQQSVT